MSFRRLPVLFVRRFVGSWRLALLFPWLAVAGLAVAGLAVACATAPPPVGPEDGLAEGDELIEAEDPSIDSLQAELQELEERIARTEARRDTLIVEALERRELALQEEDALRRSLEAALQQIDVVDRQRELKERQLESGLGTDASSEPELEALRVQLADLERQRQELEDERQRQEQRLADLRYRLDPLRELDGPALYVVETQDLFRRATELQNEIYRRLIERTASFITSPSQQEAFTRLYRERIDERDATLSAKGISGERFRELAVEFQRDRSLSTALLSGRTFRLEFQLGRYDVVHEQVADFRSLAEALQEAAYRDFDYLIFIDGHADSVTYPGGPCVSAQSNRDLSRQRAEAARDLLIQLGLPEERIRLDWYGNFLMAVAPAEGGRGEPENRRVEVRITSREQGDYTSHQDYFRMHRELQVFGRTFEREIGRWVDVACQQRTPDLTVAYLGEAYRELATQLPLEVAQPISVGDEGHHYQLWLGDDFTIEHDGRCLRVRGCSGATAGR